MKYYFSIRSSLINLGPPIQLVESCSCRFPFLKVVPEIFSGKYLLMTENGRTLVTKSGWTASRIEYTKRIRDRVILTQHVGADMLMRTCYLPTLWPLRKLLCDQTGKHKVPTDKCPMVVCDVAGPLCFGGDYIGKEEKMSLPMPGLLIAPLSAYCSGSLI